MKRITFELTDDAAEGLLALVPENTPIDAAAGAGLKMVLDAHVAALVLASGEEPGPDGMAAMARLVGILPLDALEAVVAARRHAAKTRQRRHAALSHPMLPTWERDGGDGFKGPCPLCAGEGRRAWARPFLEQLYGRMVQIEEAIEAMRATVIPAAVAAVADEEEARDAAGA